MSQICERCKRKTDKPRRQCVHCERIVCKQCKVYEGNKCIDCKSLGKYYSYKAAASYVKTRLSTTASEVEIQRVLEDVFLYNHNNFLAPQPANRADLTSRCACGEMVRGSDVQNKNQP